MNLEFKIYSRLKEKLIQFNYYTKLALVESKRSKGPTFAPIALSVSLSTAILNKIALVTMMTLAPQTIW